jgi:leucyl aminopeptidase (aminopeptidase T)
MSDNTMLSDLYEIELSKAAEIIANDLFAINPGETVVITADTESDPRVVNAFAQAAFTEGGVPMVVWTATPPGPAGMVDDFLPSSALKGALLTADCWVEFNYQYINYSKLMEDVCKRNKKLRYMILPAISVDGLVRLFVSVDQYALRDFVLAVADRTARSNKVRITSELGQDIEFENDPNNPMDAETGFITDPGITNLNGQIAWTPKLDSVNGVLIFDGSLVPQIGILNEPVKVFLEKGVIQKVEGGSQAAEWWGWLRSFDHPQMLRPAHICYGFHPAAKLSGQLGEDERVWGCTEWGFGAIGSFLVPPDGLYAPSHTDGVTLNSSVWLDGVLIMKNGEIVDQELKKLAQKLGK